MLLFKKHSLCDFDEEVAMEENKVFEQDNQELTAVEEQYVLQQPEEVLIKDSKKGRFLALWIISPILFGLVTIFLLYGFIDILNAQNPGLSFVFWFTFIYIIFGAIGYILSMIPSVIGLFLTIFKRPNGLRVGQLIYFIIFTVLPVIVWFLGTLIMPALIK